MTRVIAVMKSSLETQRMYISRVLLGSMTASTAMFCVLSQSSAAVSSGDGFIDMSHPQIRCCISVEVGASITGDLPGPQAIGHANHYWSSEGNGPGEFRGQNNLNSDDIKLVGAALTTDNPPADGSAAASDGSDASNTTNGADANQGTGTAPTDSTAGEFTGSPEPSGPDINLNEEKDLISKGWK